MEKVIVIHGFNVIFQKDMNEINEHLSMGWTIKSWKMISNDDYVNAAFVLEKPDEK